MNHSIETSAELVGFKEEIANIQTGIADFEMGQKLNIAIIAEPIAGKTMLIDEIEKMNPQKVTRLSFSSIVKNKDEIKLPEQSKRIVMVENCEFLYMRKIGGFDLLEDFLKLVTSSDNLFITTWNLYSWNYLDEVMGIGKFFPIQIKLRKLTTSEIREMILTIYEKDEIKFIKDVEFEREKLIYVVKYPFEIKLLKKNVLLLFFWIIILFIDAFEPRLM